MCDNLKLNNGDGLLSIALLFTVTIMLQLFSYCGTSSFRWPSHLNIVTLSGARVDVLYNLKGVTPTLKSISYTL